MEQADKRTKFTPVFMAFIEVGVEDGILLCHNVSPYGSQKCYASGQLSFVLYFCDCLFFNLRSTMSLFKGSFSSEC